MPRKLTNECTCERCGRIWYEDYVEGEEPVPTTRLEAKLSWIDVQKEEQSLDVKFDVLCGNCSDTLGKLMEKLGELKHRSPDKSGAKKESGKKLNSPKTKKARPQKSSAGASP